MNRTYLVAAHVDDHAARFNRAWVRTIELSSGAAYLHAMEFEWDEAKRQENLLRRGVDFQFVIQVFGDPERTDVLDDRYDYLEKRRQVVGRIGDEYYLVAYTMREARSRIITAWRLGRNGRKRYQALHDGRDTGNGG